MFGNTSGISTAFGTGGNMALNKSLEGNKKLTEQQAIYAHGVLQAPAPYNPDAPYPRAAPSAADATVPSGTLLMRDPLAANTGRYPVVTASLANHIPLGFDLADTEVDQNLWQFVGVAGPRDPNDPRAPISMATGGDVNVIAGRYPILDGDELVAAVAPRSGRVGLDLNDVDDADVFPQVDANVSRAQAPDSVFAEAIPLRVAAAKGLIATTNADKVLGQIGKTGYKPPNRLSPPGALGNAMLRFSANCIAVVLSRLSKQNKIGAGAGPNPLTAADLQLGDSDLKLAFDKIRDALGGQANEDLAAVIRQLLVTEGDAKTKRTKRKHIQRALQQIHRATFSGRSNRIGYALQNARPGQFCLTRVVPGMRNRGAFGNRAAVREEDEQGM